MKSLEPNGAPIHAKVRIETSQEGSILFGCPAGGDLDQAGLVCVWRWGCLSVSFNSLPPCSLQRSDKCWVQRHVFAYWTAQTDCTSSAHGCGHFLPLAAARKTGWPIFALNYSTIFMGILVRETELPQPSAPSRASAHVFSAFKTISPCLWP